MDISGDTFISTSADRVWDALNDPDVVRDCIPGCRTLSRLSPTTLSGVVDAGPAAGATFNVIIAQSEVVAPRACRLTVSADGGVAGSSTGVADVTLAEEGGATRLSYVGRVSVAGPLAGTGAGIGQMIDQFLRGFAARIANGDGARAHETPIVRAEHAMGEAAHEVAEVARDEVEKAEVAAGRGFLGGPQVWALLVLLAIIAALLIIR